MATLPPELEDGADPELNPLEFEELELAEFELEEPELEEPELEEPELEEPELAEPELAELELDPDEPDPDEGDPEDVELDPGVPDCDVEPDAAVLCAGPGSTRVTAPAVTTLATATAVVADRTLARPRSRAAMA